MLVRLSKYKAPLWVKQLNAAAARGSGSSSRKRARPSAAADSEMEEVEEGGGTAYVDSGSGEGEGEEEAGVTATSGDAADTNVNECSRCGQAGDLICYDGCPKAFHAACLRALGITVPDDGDDDGDDDGSSEWLAVHAVRRGGGGGGGGRYGRGWKV